MSNLSPIVGVSHAVAWLNRLSHDGNGRAIAILAELDRLRDLIATQHTCVVCGGKLLPDLADCPPFCAESKCELDIGCRDVDNDDGTPGDATWYRTDDQWRKIAEQIESICNSHMTYTRGDRP
jgi:hypothetical protein